MSRIFKWDAATTVEYPNATHFAFVPAIVKITGVPAIKDGLGVTVYDPATGKSYHEDREPHNGSGYFDIRRYLQILFSNLEHSCIDYGRTFAESPLMREARVTVHWYSGNSQQALITFSVNAVWGAISARESSGGIMRRKWFVRYPFTVDVFAKDGTTFDVQIDGKQSDVMFYNHEADATGATPYHRYLLNPAKMIDPSTVARSVHVAVPHSLVHNNDVESVGLVAYTLGIDRSTNGVYLRWIDRQGRYCYYLFKEIGRATTIAAASTWERNDMTAPTAYVDGMNIESPTRQHLTQKMTRSLGAKLVDSETFEFLLSLARSVVVDVFDGYDVSGYPQWHRVNIVPGSYEMSVKHYQDFILSIEEPTQNAQTL